MEPLVNHSLHIPNGSSGAVSGIANFGRDDENAELVDEIREQG
ncbi:hypothetical protein [Rhizobium sp. PL01]|nr:hypothetical protein [Rhizobium sp. PL01]MDW5316997.1 hypothetical protein [Rhizobium sp. PL01]